MCYKYKSIITAMNFCQFDKPRLNQTEGTIRRGQSGGNTLFAVGSSETVVSGVVLEVSEVVGGGVEKLNVGKVKLLGREAGGRSGSSAT